jgi:hypothetical protein
MAPKAAATAAGGRVRFGLINDLLPSRRARLLYPRKPPRKSPAVAGQWQTFAFATPNAFATPSLAGRLCRRGFGSALRATTSERRKLGSRRL